MDRTALVNRYLQGQVSRRVFIRKMMATGISAMAAIGYADVLMTSPASAAAGDFYILVFDYGFTPSQANPVKQGQTLEWGFKVGNSHAHSATDTTGMNYFDSGFKPGGSAFFKTFIAAGHFTYHCKETTHSFAPMNGTIRVPVKVQPSSGPLGTTFTITWASHTAPSGFVFDVQIKRPGDTAFSDWKTGQTAPSATFKPAKTGQFQFRSRLRRTVTGASGYSSPKTIAVT